VLSLCGAVAILFAGPAETDSVAPEPVEAAA